MHLRLVTNDEGDERPEAAQGPAPTASTAIAPDVSTVPTGDVDYGALAHRAAVDHLAACWEAFYAAEEGEEAESPASAPFCGCEDCVVRETLHAAWPFLEAAARG